VAEEHESNGIGEEKGRFSVLVHTRRWDELLA
jgi:hypothetical protein